MIVDTAEDALVDFEVVTGEDGAKARLPKGMPKKLLEGQELTKFVDQYEQLGIEWLQERLREHTPKDGSTTPQQYIESMMAKLRGGNYGPLEQFCFYVKTQTSGDPSERALFHIHVDAQEPLPSRATLALIGAGITYDLFDTGYGLGGKDGDPNKNFPQYSPVQHMTIATRNYAEYEDRWWVTANVIHDSGAKCYNEGEYITHDIKIKSKPFDQTAYDALVPLIKTTDQQSMDYAFTSAYSSEVREVPAKVKLRRLQPGVVDPKTKRKDPEFRSGEIHLTLRSDSDPRLLQLLGNLGYSCPGIPKLIEDESGRLMKNADGSLLEVIDIPFTLQTLNMKTVQRLANLSVYLCEQIGGVTSGSWKLEVAPHYAVQGGVDYYKHVPPIIDELIIHPRFAALPDNMIGDHEIDLGNSMSMLLEMAKGSETIADEGKRLARHHELFDLAVKESISIEALLKGSVTERRVHAAELKAAQAETDKTIEFPTTKSTPTSQKGWQYIVRNPLTQWAAAATVMLSSSIAGWQANNIINNRKHPLDTKPAIVDNAMPFGDIIKIRDPETEKNYYVPSTLFSSYTELGTEVDMDMLVQCTFGASLNRPTEYPNVKVVRFVIEDKNGKQTIVHISDNNIKDALEPIKAVMRKGFENRNLVTDSTAFANLSNNQRKYLADLSSVHRAYGEL